MLIIQTCKNWTFQRAENIKKPVRSEGFFFTISSESRCIMHVKGVSLHSTNLKTLLSNCSLGNTYTIRVKHPYIKFGTLHL